MDYQTACNVLELGNFDQDELKRKYHKMALQYHPDKNGNSADSIIKFQLINEAYDTLKNEPIPKKSESRFSTILKIIVSVTGYNDVFAKVIQEITTKVSINALDDLDNDTCVKVYNFLNNHKELLDISDELIETIRVKIETKQQTIYNLHPTIDDLLNDTVYKLVIDEQTFLVPLWHSELYFDYLDSAGKKKSEIVVVCEPILPDGITIDEYGNIFTSVVLQLADLVIGKNITIYIGCKSFPICVNKLFLKSEQIYKITGCGLPKLKRDIYNIAERADIIVNVNIIQ